MAAGPATLEYADFVVVLTTVPAAEMKLAMVLEFYRARWPVDLAFKRLKSLLEMGQLPKSKAASCRAWMQGKILTALLIERVLYEARFFSPRVIDFEDQSQWSIFKEARDALLVQLVMPLNPTTAPGCGLLGICL